jgi:hypothetical protein
MNNDIIKWKDINPLVLRKVASAKIPLGAIFGEDFAKYLRDISQASGCSVDYTVLNLLVITSVIIGNRKYVHVRNGWTEEPTHLWGALVGSPSTKKTSSMRPVLRAMAQLTEARKIEYGMQKREYKIQLEKYANKELSEEPKKPILRQILINDATVEAIHKAIDPENPECICIYRDELTGLIGTLSKYNDGDRSFFLEGYNSNQYTINRAKYEEPIVISKLSLSILGTIQPQKMKSILRGADDGFTSRLLFAFPDPIISEEPETDISENILSLMFKKMDQLPAKEKKISLTKEAREEFNKWHMENEIKTQRYISGLLQSSYGKMGGQVVRIACVLEHIFWALSDESEPPKEISLNTVIKAIVLIEDYFKPMAQKVLSECLRDDSDYITQSFIKYLTDNKIVQFNLRELKRKYVLNFENKQQAEDDFLSTLIDANVIKQIETNKTGRPLKNYAVNPKLAEIKL